MHATKDRRSPGILCHPLGLLCLGWLLSCTLGKTIRYHTYEEDPPGTVIGTLADELPLKGIGGGGGGERSFRLMKQSGNSSLVRVRERDGQLSLGTERLDREQLCGQAEEPCVLAFDVVSLGGGGGGAAASASQYRLVHVELEVRDINDHAPRFPTPLIALEVSESAAPGTRLPLDLAHDLDVGSNGIQSFAVSPNSHFASSSGSAPAGATTVAYVSEAAPAESLVALVSTSDSDAGANGQVRCALLAAPHEPFALQRAYDASYVVLTTGPLDRERVAEYNLTVVAEDLGSPPAKTVRRLTVRLADENDNAPRFARARYEVAVLENNPPGAYLAAVQAADPDLGPNGKVTYRLLDSQIMGASISTYVSVDPATGAIYALRTFNYEILKQLDLTVQATDGGSPQLSSAALVKVRVVDQNDNAPVITHPAFSNGSLEIAVSSKAARDSLVAHVKARDADEGVNAELRFAFQEDLLSQQQQQQQHPAFSNGSLEIAVSSKAARDSLVAHVKARDADEGVNAELRFAFQEDLLSQQQQQQQQRDQQQHLRALDLFAINEKTGEVVLRRSLSEEELDQVYPLLLTVSDNGRPPLSTTATVSFQVTAALPPPSSSSPDSAAKASSWEGKAVQWDVPLIVIVVLAGSCTLLLVAIITIATTCNRRKKKKKTGALEEPLDALPLEKGRPEGSVSGGGGSGGSLASPSPGAQGSGFGMHSFPSKSSFASPEPSPASEDIPASENSQESASLYDSQSRLRGTNLESYTSAPSYSKESAPPVAIWKGHSFNTIAGREAEKFSGKDSGKGDSDFNDSDSDISGDALKKDLITHMQNGLWACTAECKILGHSDRCWSPSCGRSNPHSSPHPKTQLSTFCKSTSLPRDSLRRDNYYHAQLPKTVGLQSVYEKVLHRDYDRTMTLLSPPHPGRLPDLQEISVPLYQAPSTRYLGPPPETGQKV
nr:protocadherin-8 [Pogona vitticeps]